MKIKSKSDSFVIAISVILAVFFIFPSYASADRAEIEAAILKARDSVMSYFPTLEGTVVEVMDNKTKVEIGSPENAKAGMRMSVFRKGEPFYHPITKERIGNTETYKGTIEITDERDIDGSIICNLIDGNAGEGDIVRISSSKIRIAFFQDRKAEWSVSEVFYGFLKDTGRFEILESYTPTYAPEKLSGLSRELGAEALLLLSTPVKNEEKVINIKLYWTRDTKLFADVEESVGSGQISVFSPAEEFISGSLSEREPWGTFELTSGELIAMGDVDGNGKRELVISDGYRIRIYMIEDELVELWLVKGSASEKHLSIDVLDLNSNGRSEIFVTAMTGVEPTGSEDREAVYETTGMKTGRLNSFVIEYGDTGYKKIADKIPYFLRVAGNKLLMQESTRNRLFTGPVYEGRWEKGEYKPGKVLNLPDDVNIYGFTAVDWMSRKEPQFLSYSDDGYLNLYDSKGELLWRSPGSYGNFDLVLERETQSVANPMEKKAIRGRLVPVLTDRGQEVMVVKRIPILDKVPGLGKKAASVYSLWWDGSAMDEKLILTDLSGTISDFWIEENRVFLIARGSIFSFARHAMKGDFVKGSVLYYYNFSKK
jgi:hypothetical protein